MFASRISVQLILLLLTTAPCAMHAEETKERSGFKSYFIGMPFDEVKKNKSLNCERKITESGDAHCHQFGGTETIAGASGSRDVVLRRQARIDHGDIQD